MIMWQSQIENEHVYFDHVTVLKVLYTYIHTYIQTYIHRVSYRIFRWGWEKNICIEHTHTHTHTHTLFSIFSLSSDSYSQ